MTQYIWKLIHTFVGGCEIKMAILNRDSLLSGQTERKNPRSQENMIQC